MENNNQSGYGKKPLWQWILIYVVVGGIVYAFIYYYFFAQNGGYGSGAAPAPAENSQANNVSGGEFLKIAESPSLGKYLAAENGMSLYIFNNDKPGVSNCSGGCAVNWPPYKAPDSGAITAAAGISGKIETIKRADGSMQITYNGMPLYFWINDKKPGDTTGSGVGGAWSLAKP